MGRHCCGFEDEDEDYLPPEKGADSPAHPSAVKDTENLKEGDSHAER
jgi:hypothetical protein